MFKNLSNFKHQRSLVQALGFYIAYNILCILIGAIAGGIMGALNNETTQSAAIAGSKTGMVIAPIFTLYIAFTIIIKKQRANHFGLIIIALLSGIGAIVGGSILGLIPATILTTFKNK